MVTKILIVFLIFFVSYNVCIRFKPKSEVDFLINEEEAKRFPWTVLICSTSRDLASDGSLIHQKVVLTSVTYEKRFHDYDFRVFAGCYHEHQGNIRIMYQACQQNRTIREWSVLIKNEAEYYKNIAFILVSEPFQVTEQVNVISLQKIENDVNFDSCAIVYYSDKCSRINDCEITYQYFSSLTVRINKKMIVKFNYNVRPGPPFILDDRFRKYVYEEIPDDLINFTFTGSPVICRSMTNSSNWLQIGISGLRIQNFVKNQEFKIFGYLVLINNQEITVFDKILQLFRGLNEVNKLSNSDKNDLRNLKL